ncbi:MAG: hypothetical protein ACXWAT_12155 [Methylobacter sp.]
MIAACLGSRDVMWWPLNMRVAPTPLTGELRIKSTPLPLQRLPR